MADWLNNKSWQRLLGLESVDVVRDWHKKICKRELSTKRATEIASSAKQAREYFKNAANAANTVRSRSLSMALLRLPDLHYCFSSRVAEKNLLSVATGWKPLIGRLRSRMITRTRPSDDFTSKGDSMKRTILALTLTLLLSCAVPAQEVSIDDADLRIPSPTSSLSSNGQEATPYIEDTPGSPMNSILYVMLSAVSFGL